MNASAPGGEIAMVLMIGMMLFLAVVLYFLPTFVAGLRGHPNTAPIFVLNMFLGFTGAGWIVSLVWALTQVPYPSARCGGAKAIVGALTLAACCLGALGMVMTFTFSARSSESHAHHAVVQARVAEGRANLPAEEKIQTLKQEVNNLTPAINKQRTVVAQETVEVANWTKQVATKKAQLQEDETSLTAMRQAIQDDTGYKTPDGDRIPSNMLKQHFARKFEEYKAVKQATTSAEETLARHRQRRDIAQQTLRDLESKQQELKARVETLEIELAKLREADLKDESDDGKVADVKRRVEDLETRIAVEKKKRDLDSAKSGDAVDRDIESTLKEKTRSKDALKEWDSRGDK